MHFDTNTNICLLSKWKSEKNPCWLSGNTPDFVASGGHLSHLVRFHNFSQLPPTDFSSGEEDRHRCLQRFHIFLNKNAASASGSQWQRQNRLKRAWGCTRPQRLSANSRNPEAPDPGPGCREGKASCSQPGMQREPKVTKQLRSVTPQGKVSWALHSRHGGRFPTAAGTRAGPSEAPRPERDPHPGPCAKPAPPPGPRVRRQPSPAPAQLCSASTLAAFSPKSRRPAAAARSSPRPRPPPPPRPYL